MGAYPIAIRWCAIAAALTAALALGAPTDGLDAQLAILRFRSWSIDDGLPHDAIYALHQDQTGHVWVGTQDGLSRLDAQGFLTIRHDVDDPLSLSDGHVSVIHDDGDGGLWVGTYQGWLNRYDVASGRVERIGPPRSRGARSASLVGRAVYDVASLGSERLLLATELGALVYDHGNGMYRPVEQAAAASQPPSATALFVEEDHRIWIGYADGRLLTGTQSGDSILLTLAAQLRVEISAIRRGPDRRLWVGTRGRGVFELDTDGAVRSRLHAAGEPEHRLLHDRVQDIRFDRDGALWVATISGLSIFPAQVGSPSHVIADDSDPWGLPDQRCLVLMEDRTGGFWVGTVSGLGRVHPYDEAFTRVLARGPARDGIAGSGALTVASAASGALWVGTYGQGLDRLDLRSGAVEHYPPDANGLLGPFHGEVKSLAIDREGTLWMGTMGGGISRLNPSTGTFARVSIAASIPNVDVGLVPSVFVHRTGEVWAGTQFDGLHWYDDHHGVFRRFRGPDETWEFGSDYVWPLMEGRDGTLWVGAFRGGVSAIEPGGQAVHWLGVANSALPSDLILTLSEGPDGHIWIGTEGAGLIRFDPRTETFTSFTTRDGLPHNNVQAILLDREGNLWISTNDGLARMDRSGVFTAFSPDAGLHGRRFYANSALALPDGRLVFGGEGGLTIVMPDRLRLIREPSPVVLTGFTVSGEPRPVAAEELNSAIDLAPTENFFAFRFAALDYADPESVVYRYRLDPLDSDWVESGGSGSANYTSVPPNSYTFRVSARNSFGVWNEDALTIPLVVHPPFHATLWFRSLVLAAVASLLTAAYVYRMHQIRRLHEVRFNIAGGLHDEVGANLSAIALRSEAARATRSLDEQSREALAVVARIARETTDVLRDTVWVVSTRYDTVAGLFTKLRDTADLLLGDDISCSYSATPDPPQRLLDMELRQDVYLIFKEALHNIVKHARAKRVDITVRYDRPMLALIVADDGRGFDTEAPNDGNGLALMRGRAERHGGRLDVSSTPGAGTRLELRVRMR